MGEIVKGVFNFSKKISVRRFQPPGPPLPPYKDVRPRHICRGPVFLAFREQSVRGLLVELLHSRLAGELDAPALVDVKALDLDDVADLADAVHRLEELVGELRDVAEAVHAGEDLDERAEVLDAGA